MDYKMIYIYQLRFTADLNYVFNGKIIIGQLNNINQIISIRITFHGSNDDILCDRLGNSIEYASDRHDLGHVLNIPLQEFVNSYAKCWLTLQPNSNFNLNKNIRIYNAVFRVRWFSASPDTYSREILSLNDQIPAPTIIVKQGDIINITLINESSEPTAIHWHGLLQRNTLHMDGVTQCSILLGQSFQYKYSTNDQSGTYWYHSHYAMQYGDGLKGVLIIKDPKDPWEMFYQDEEILQLTDWYHTPAHIHLKSYLYPGILDAIPDTALFNGIGQYDCDLNKKCSFYRISIKSSQTKRFRIINTSVYATITLTIDQHDMRLIEIDGIYLNGNKYVKTLRLNPGQRYSALITGKTNVYRNYLIQTTMHPFLDYNNQYKSSIQPNIKAI
ncbi:hypothetical protein I4U23_015103 [Adineta vaga]|nr:hypothetical protein I4U23_015103 [Adineta vaga]